MSPEQPPVQGPTNAPAFVCVQRTRLRVCAELTAANNQVTAVPTVVMATAVQPSPAFSPLKGPQASAEPDSLNLLDAKKMSDEMHAGVNAGDIKAVKEALEKGEVTDAETKFGEQ
eukprot:COSAG06_NODE_22241_length_730_cov_0.740095_2_plen_114_part_01